MLQLISRIWYDPGVLSVDIQPTSELAIKTFVSKLHEGLATVQLKKWYRLRSTGWKSQNHHLNSHVQQIAEETGNDFETVKVYIKTEAIARGYNYDILQDIVVPWSETRADTLQCSILIDGAHMLAAEYGVNLREE
jgi:hypothetical protein